MNRVRGLTPWPGAYTYYGEERWLIQRAAPSETSSAEAEPGTILEAMKDAIRVATASGSVLIHELQPSSGKRVTVNQYLAGHAVTMGSQLTPQPSPPIAS